MIKTYEPGIYSDDEGKKYYIPFKVIVKTEKDVIQ